MTEPLTEHRRIASHVGDDRAESRAHRFEEAHGGPLAPRSHREQREAGMQIRDVVPPAQEVHGGPETELTDQLFELGPLAPLATQNEHRWPTVGPLGSQACERFNHDVVALDRLEAADASDHGCVNGDPELASDHPRVSSRTE